MKETSSAGVPPARKIAQPYVGLRPFDVEDAAIFFGRGGQIADMLGVLRAEHFLAVIGASGSGKSSLVRAGLLPAIRRGFLGVRGDDWRIAVFSPGRAPFENLVQELCRATGRDAGSDVDQLHYWQWTVRSGPRGLFDLLNDWKWPSGKRLLLVVDQFEELFRFAGLGTEVRVGQAANEAGESRASQAVGFVEMLRTTAEARDPRVYPILTMRSEFLGDCEAFADLSPLVSRASYLTTRLEREELREVIVQPARRLGVTVDSAVVNQLLNTISLAPDQLPRLEHLLLRIWTRFFEGPQSSPRPKQIGQEHYQAVGSFDRALCQHLDEIYDELGKASDGEECQRVARRVFLELCQQSVDGPLVRRPRTMAQLADVARAKPELLAAVVAAFGASDCCFLRVSQIDGQPAEEALVDISHESLLRQWLRLRDQWLPAEMEAVTVFRRLVEDAESDAQNPDESILWRSTKLNAGLQWWREFRPNPVWAQRYLRVASSDDARSKFCLALRFLAASRRHARKEKQQELARELQAKQQLEQQASEERQRADSERKRADAERRSAEIRQRLNRALGGLVVLMLVVAVLANSYRRSAEQNAQVARRAETRAQLLLNEQRVSAAVEAFNLGFTQRGQELLEQVRATTASGQLGWEWRYGQSFVDARFQPRFATPWHLSGNPGEAVRKMSCSTDGKWLAAVGNRRLAIWDLAKGVAPAVWRWPPAVPDTAGPGAGSGEAESETSRSRQISPFPVALNFTDDGRRLILLEKQRITIFERAGDGFGNVPRQIPLRGRAWQGRLSHDGRSLWIALSPPRGAEPSPDQVVHVDLATGAVEPLPVRSELESVELGSILDLKLHPNDAWLFVLHRPAARLPVQLAIVDRQGKQLAHAEIEKGDDITQLAIHPGGSRIVFVRATGELIVSNIQRELDGSVTWSDGTFAAVPPTQKSRRALSFAGPNAEWMVTSDGSSTIAWVDLYPDPDSFTTLPVVGRATLHNGDAVGNELAVNRANGEVLSADSSGGIWLCRTLPQLPGMFTLPMRDRAEAVAINTQGSRIAIASPTGVTLWDAPSGYPLERLKWETLFPVGSEPSSSDGDFAPCLSWIPDRESLVVSRGMNAVCWDTVARRVVTRMKDAGDDDRGRSISRILADSTGRRVALGISDVAGTPGQTSPIDEWRVWDLEADAPVHDFDEHLHASMLAFLPSRQGVVFGVIDGIDVTTASGKLNRTISFPEQQRDELFPYDCSDLTCDSGDGWAYMVLNADQQQSQLWRANWRTGRIGRLNEAPASPVKQLVFLPGRNGQLRTTSRLAVVTQDEVRICAVNDGREVLRWRPDNEKVAEIAADAAGERLVARLESGRVMLAETGGFASAEEWDHVAPQVEAALREDVLAEQVLQRMNASLGDNVAQRDLALLLLRNRTVSPRRLVEWACSFLQSEGLPIDTLERVAQRLLTARRAQPENLEFRLLHNVALVRQSTAVGVQQRPGALAAKALGDLEAMDAKQLTAPILKRLHRLATAWARYQINDHDPYVEGVLQEMLGTSPANQSPWSANAKQARPVAIQSLAFPSESTSGRGADAVGPPETQRPGGNSLDRLADGLFVDLAWKFRVDVRALVIDEEVSGEQVKVRLSAKVAYCPTKRLEQIMRSAESVVATLNGRELGRPRQPRVEREGRQQILTWEWEPVPVEGPLCQATLSLLDPTTKREIGQVATKEIPQALWPEPWRKRPTMRLLVVEVSELGQAGYGGGGFTFPKTRDAELVTQAFRVPATAFYLPGEAIALTGRRATSDALIAGLQAISQAAHENDVTVIYLAGPGFRDLTSDNDEQTGTKFAAYDRMMDWSEIWSKCKAIRGRKLVVVDGSRAGKAAEFAERDPLQSCFLLLATSREELAAFTDSNGGVPSGAFTQRILRGLSGGAAGASESDVTLGELVDYATALTRASLTTPEIWPREKSRWPQDLPLVTVPQGSDSTK